MILIFIMAGSLLALILTATNLLGYSNSLEAAAEAYEQGNYEAAYQEISGLTVKEEDAQLCERYKIMANAAGVYNAYLSFSENDMQDMALDSLIRTVGRCHEYEKKAKVNGCEQELGELLSTASAALAEYGMDESKALSLYEIGDRKEYSTEVYTILQDMGWNGGSDDSDN